LGYSFIRGLRLLLGGELLLHLDGNGIGIYFVGIVNLRTKPETLVP
jgi:hypothetical protein